MLKSFLPGWVFFALDASGHSGGLAIGYKEGRMKILNHWGLKNTLGLEVLSPDFPFPLTIVNVYGPCQSRDSFWDDLMSKSVMNNLMMILGGDLNFSLRRNEAWGPSAREDPLAEFFHNLISEHNLIDPAPVKLKPTWRNRRVGGDRIAKRLDRFLVSEYLFSRIPMIRQWVEEIGNSDHFPIFLDMTNRPPKPPAPFKFNPPWIQDPTYCKVFNDTWIHQEQDIGVDKSFLFMENLKRLKKATISCAKEKKMKQSEDLSKIREELKSRKTTNTIWRLKDEEGREFSTFPELSGLGKRHFQNIFTDQREATIAEVFRTVHCFPRFIEEDEAEDLSVPVTKEEFEAAMKLMGKDKSPGPDGWTIELFLHFFEQIGAEITEVVEESRQKGTIYRPFNSTFIALIPKKDDPESFEDF
eukprot:PITA_05268